MAVYTALWLFLPYHGTAELSSQSLEGLKYPALYTVHHKWLRRCEASSNRWALCAKSTSAHIWSGLSKGQMKRVSRSSVGLPIVMSLTS